MPELKRVNRPLPTINRIVPHGPWNHKASGLSNRTFDLHPHESEGVVYSSAWLWKNSKALLQAPRIAITFPNEWSALIQDRDLAQIQTQICFDFWIFKDLTSQEEDQLQNLLATQSNSRLIITPNYLLQWQSLVQKSFVKFFLREKRVFLSFLEPRHELDPFLKPPEVLDALEKLENDIPLLAYDFSPKEVSSFYQTLRPEDYKATLSGTSALIYSLFRKLDNVGFHHVVLLFDTLLAMFLEGPRRRGPQFLMRIFGLFAEVGKACVKCLAFGGNLWSYLWRYLLQKVWLVLCRFGHFSQHMVRTLFYGLRFLMYPLRKIYWFAEYQYQTRLKGDRPDES